MGKYKIYKNKKIKYHPSIHISINLEGKWENIEITSSPTKKHKYIQFDHNPNPSWKDRNAFFRKYIRKDPLGARGEEFKNYVIGESDEKKIDEYVKNNKKAMKQSRRKKCIKKRKKKTR